MKFFIEDLYSYSPKAFHTTIKFINTNTIIDGCTIQIFIPKSIQILPNEEFDIPYFICKGIWKNDWNIKKHIQSIQKQVQAKAPKGLKRDWRNQVPELFKSLEKFNIEEEKDEIPLVGNFVGKLGDKILITLKIDKILYSVDWNDGGRWVRNDENNGWQHPHGTTIIWKFLDNSGNIYTFKNSGVTNNKINDAWDNGKNIIVSAEIGKLKIFKNEKQNELWNLRIKGEC